MSILTEIWRRSEAPQLRVGRGVGAALRYWSIMTDDAVTPRQPQGSHTYDIPDNSVDERNRLVAPGALSEHHVGADRRRHAGADDDAGGQPRAHRRLEHGAGDAPADERGDPQADELDEYVQGEPGRGGG